MINSILYHAIEPLPEVKAFYRKNNLNVMDMLEDLMVDLETIMEKDSDAYLSTKGGKFTLVYSLNDFKNGGQRKKDEFIKKRFKSLPAIIYNSPSIESQGEHQ